MHLMPLAATAPGVVTKLAVTAFLVTPVKLRRPTTAVTITKLALMAVHTLLRLTIPQVLRLLAQGRTAGTPAAP